MFCLFWFSLISLKINSSFRIGAGKTIIGLMVINIFGLLINNITLNWKSFTSLYFLSANYGSVYSNRHKSVETDKKGKGYRHERVTLIYIFLICSNIEGFLYVFSLVIFLFYHCSVYVFS